MVELAGKLGFVQTFPFSTVSVSSLLFLCFTVLRECHCTKSAMLQITVFCDLTHIGHLGKEDFGRYGEVGV